MKTIIIFLTSFLFICFGFSYSFANPMLTCDETSATEQVTHFIIEVNGEIWIENSLIYDPDGDGAGTIMQDLSGLANGDYIVRAKAANAWGESDWSLPFEFSKRVPLRPVLKILLSK